MLGSEGNSCFFITTNMGELRANLLYLQCYDLKPACGVLCKIVFCNHRCIVVIVFLTIHKIKICHVFTKSYKIGTQLLNY